MKIVKNMFWCLMAAGYLSLAGCATAQYNNNIFDAVYANDIEGVKRLLANGTDVNATFMTNTPLHSAAANGNVEMIKLLLDSGARIDAVAAGATPLDSAIWAHRTDAALYLIKRGANVNAVSTWKHKFTPIIYCAIYGDAKIAAALIDAGADITVRDNKGLSASDYARKYKKMDVLAALSKAGAPMSYTGSAREDIIMAAISGDKQKILELLQEGADANSKDKSGKSLLEYAVENRWYKVVESLIQKGANTTVKDKDGWTMLMKAALDNQQEIIGAFERAGARLDYTGNKKDDLLYAVLKNDYEKAKLLLVQGVDVNSTYRYKSPILNYAIVKKDSRLIKLFMDNNADLNLANQYGVSPFIAALSNGDMALAKDMINKGANARARDGSGFSALFYAVKSGDAGFVKTLLDKGAQVDASVVALSEGRNPQLKQVNFPEITAMIKPELLRKQMLRAEAAQEVAQSVEDYQKVLAEYETAKQIAPETPEIWYNIGLIQDKAGAYNEAIASLRKYLELAPNAADVQEVKDMIYKLEYKRDQGR